MRSRETFLGVASGEAFYVGFNDRMGPEIADEPSYQYGKPGN